MTLPVERPYLPMEAEAAREMPSGPEWQYEPKWDGFRCLAFRDGAQLELQSKAGQDLTRYFPELVEALLAVPAKRFVLDGEIVVPADGNLSFDELLMRIHPAESRIRKLAAEHPCLFIVFDLLVDANGKLWANKPLHERRDGLQQFSADFLTGSRLVRLSPATRDIEVARNWFKTMAGGLDGIIAKQVDLPYQSGERGGMVKIKNLRTADCVVGGFRYAEKAPVVGSLLLGLYENGSLNHVGFTSGIKAADREQLTKKLERLIKPPGFTGNAPGGPSRWNTKRSTEWQPLEPKLVVEVQYDHFSGRRFRHGTRLLRWRPDKAPRQCTIEQVRKESRSPLNLLDSSARSA